MACPLFNLVKVFSISYDGYAFAGFQRQPHARSVQEEMIALYLVICLFYQENLSATSLKTKNCTGAVLDIN